MFGPVHSHLLSNNIDCLSLPQLELFKRKVDACRTRLEEDSCYADEKVILDRHIQAYDEDTELLRKIEAEIRKRILHSKL